MAVVCCCDGNREWYRDVLVSEGELYCGPRAPDNPPRTMSRPTGEYDLAAYVRRLPPPWRDPTLVVVFHDTGGNSIPRNLAALGCPKILIIGDTHHICAPGRGPIAWPLAHGLAERYDLAVGEFNRQHMHFFLEAGIRAGWLPAFTLTPFEHPANGPKKHEVTFVGQTGRHPYRHHVMEQLAALGIAVERGAAPQRETAVLQAESRINLNVSLNGDVNLRCFEVPAAGGLLMTDRLSPESGLNLLYEDRRHMVMFDNVLQLAELIRHYLARPAETAEIAAAGQARYQQAHRPALKAEQLLAALAGNVPEIYDLRRDGRTALPAQDPESLRKRIALYEFLQELHRTSLFQEVLFWPGAERHATDAMDLPRLRATVFHGNPAGADLLIGARLDGRANWIVPADLPRRTWTAAVCPAAALGDAALQQALRTRRWGILVIADFEPQRDARAAEGLAQALGLRRISSDPPAFNLAAAPGL